MTCKRYLAAKHIEKGNLGVRFTCSSLAVNHNSGMSTDGDVNDHPETSTKHSNPNAKITPTTTLSTTGPIRMGEAEDKAFLGGPHVSYSTSLASGERHISCLSNQSKTTFRVHILTNFY